MFGRLWLFGCLVAALHVSAHSQLSPQRLALEAKDLEHLSNGERVARGLSLKKPTRRGTPRYHALQPRASEAPPQNTVIEATTGGLRRRAGQYIAFDSGRNAFRLTSNLAEAATFSVPSSTVGTTQVRFYTSEGLYYFGASADSATTSSTTFSVRGTNSSDLGHPMSSQTQTTIWSFAGIPGALTGSFFALNTTNNLYLSIDSGQYIVASSSPAEASARVSLSLTSLDAIGKGVNSVAAPQGGGAPITGPDIDPELSVLDSALNTGAGEDEAALLKLMECLGGLQTPECDVILASLTPPQP